MNFLRRTTSAREYAADCLAWHVDAPSATSHLSGNALTDAIYAAADANGLDLRKAENIATIPGLGITARVDGKFYAIGLKPLFAMFDIRIAPDALSAIARTRLAGQDAVLIGSWKGVEHVVAFGEPQAAIVNAA